MINPVDQPKVSDLDANAVMDALDAWHLDKRRTYASTPKSGMEAAIRAYLAALPQPQATTVGVTDDALGLVGMVIGIDQELLSLSAKRFGQVGVIEAFGQELEGLHHRLHVLAVGIRTLLHRSAPIGIPGAEKGEAVAELVRRLRKGHQAITPAPGARYYHVPPTALELEAADALDKSAAPTSERVQALEEALAALADQTEVLLSVEDDMPTAKQDYADTEAALERARAALKATP